MSASSGVLTVRLGIWRPFDEGRERLHELSFRHDELPAEVELDQGEKHALCPERVTESGGLTGCVACGHPELYTRKDFPQTLGIIIVVVAAVLAPFTYYISLGVAALLDFILYRTARDVVVCYVCQARHHGFDKRPRHPAFDREIEERLRYGAKAVMGRPMREGGTADAPDPEH